MTELTRFPDGLWIVQAGASAVTDLGRYGYLHLGIQTNGALDQIAARTANALVGNDDGAPLIEATMIVPFVFRTSETMLIAVTGATGGITMSGIKIPSNTPVLTWPGAEIRMEAARAGLRAYVAVHGLMQGDEFLGSVARDPVIGRGRKLANGDLVAVADSQVHATAQVPLFLVTAPKDVYPDTWELDILPGPDLYQFPSFADDVARASFVVDTNSDQMGIRLNGSSFTRTTTTEILSRGVPLGAIEQPPNGGPIVLMRGRPPTAGYPVPAVVARSSHAALGQLRPGAVVTLRMTTPSLSLHLLRQQEERLANLRKRCSAMYEASRLFRTTPTH